MRRQPDEYYKHFNDVPRRTLDAGTSEAARRALYYLCHVYKEELWGTEFQQFPRRMKGATSAQIPAPPLGEESLLMDTTQELVATLNTDLDAAGAEIQEVKRKLQKMLREKAILEAQLRGDQELPLEFDCLGESPPRKRVHYGEPGYRTSYR